MRELTAQISADELIEWQAFDLLDPIGGYRQDLHAAMIAKVFRGNDGSKFDDFLVVNPCPMTDEQREKYENQQHREQLELSTQRMAAMFEKKNPESNQ